MVRLPNQYSFFHDLADVTSSQQSITPMEEFNLKIIQSQFTRQDLGDSAAKPDQQQHPAPSQQKSPGLFPPVYSPKPQGFEIYSTVGRCHKIPRSRLTNQAMSCYSFDKLPPPNVGKTLGHGINEGINPHADKTMEQLLERLNSNSLDSAHSLNSRSVLSNIFKSK